MKDNLAELTIVAAFFALFLACIAVMTLFVNPMKLITPILGIGMGAFAILYSLGIFAYVTGTVTALFWLALAAWLAYQFMTTPKAQIVVIESTSFGGVA